MNTPVEAGVHSAEAADYICFMFNDHMLPHVHQRRRHEGCDWGSILFISQQSTAVWLTLNGYPPVAKAVRCA